MKQKEEFNNSVETLGQITSGTLTIKEIIHKQTEGCNNMEVSILIMTDNKNYREESIKEINDYLKEEALKRELVYCINVIDIRNSLEFN